MSRGTSSSLGKKLYLQRKGDGSRITYKLFKPMARPSRAVAKSIQEQHRGAKRAAKENKSSLT